MEKKEESQLDDLSNDETDVTVTLSLLNHSVLVRMCGCAHHEEREEDPE